MRRRLAAGPCRGRFPEFLPRCIRGAALVSHASNIIPGGASAKPIPPATSALLSSGWSLVPKRTSRGHRRCVKNPFAVQGFVLA